MIKADEDAIMRMIALTGWSKENIINKSSEIWIKKEFSFSGSARKKILMAGSFFDISEKEARQNIDETMKKAAQLGKTLARRDDVMLVSGGGRASSMPHIAITAAKKVNPEIPTIAILGVPFKEFVKDKDEEYLSNYDMAICFDSSSLPQFPECLMYLAYRDIIQVNLVDIIFTVMGGAGTMGEISQGYYAGKTMGFLKGSGGFSDVAYTMLSTINASGQRPEGTVFFEDDEPKKLIEKAFR